ncbi:hypothetical protein IG631_05700 [Alternaria alternata]|nr:hypothetical protein IG631_05700 [Alternaria alternata]
MVRSSQHSTHWVGRVLKLTCGEPVERTNVVKATNRCVSGDSMELRDDLRGTLTPRH